MAFKPTDYPDVLVPVSGTNRYIRNIYQGSTLLWRHKWTLTIPEHKVGGYSVITFTVKRGSTVDANNVESYEHEYNDGDEIQIEFHINTTNFPNYVVSSVICNTSLLPKHTDGCTLDEINAYGDQSICNVASDKSSASIVIKENMEIKCTVRSTSGNVLKLIVGNPRTLSNETKKSLTVGACISDDDVANLSEKINLLSYSANSKYSKDITTTGEFSIPTTTTQATIYAHGTSSCYEFIGFTTDLLDGFKSSRSFGKKVTKGVIDGFTCYELTDNDKAMLTGGVDFLHDNHCHITTCDMSQNRTVYAWFAHVYLRWDTTPNWNAYDNNNKGFVYTEQDVERISAELIANGYTKIGTSGHAHPTVEMLSMPNDSVYKGYNDQRDDSTIMYAVSNNKVYLYYRNKLKETNDRNRKVFKVVRAYVGGEFRYGIYYHNINNEHSK